jgi:multidrug resistance efflux pump
MSQTPTPVQEPRGYSQASRDEVDSGDSTVKFLDAALWERLSQSESIEDLALAWLALLCRTIDGAQQALLLLEAADNVFETAAMWPDGAGKLQALADTAKIALSERRGVVREAGTQSEHGRIPDARGIIAAYPLLLDARVKGAVAVHVDQKAGIDSRLVLRQIQWGLAWILDRLRAASSKTQGRLLSRSSIALDLVGASLEHDGLKPAAMGVVTEIALRCGFDRVSLGFLQNGSVKVNVISHSAAFGQHMNLVRCIGAAMDEAIDQRTTILYPPPDTQVLATTAHAELARLQDDLQILTIPLFSIDRFIGGMTFERSSDAPIDQETVLLLGAATATIGPILEEKRRNDRWIGAKIAESVTGQVKTLFGPGHVARKLIASAAVVVLIFFAVAHQTYRADAEARVEGLVRRAVVAPYDGFIQDANARAGDTVHKNDVLASLDDRDMTLERLRWVTERQQRSFEYDKALANRQPAVINVTRSQIAQAEAQIQLLDEQLARVKMRAPIDGVIVSGDLSQMIGASVTRGQMLFEVAPLTGYRVILSVDERQIGDINIGETGAFVTTALPNEPFTFTVEKLLPIAEVKDGKNTFRVEGRITAASHRLRPGMEGVAKIDIGRRLLISIWSKPIVDWTRLWLWRWLP